MADEDLLSSIGLPYGTVQSVPSLIYRYFEVGKPLHINIMKDVAHVHWYVEVMNRIGLAGTCTHEFEDPTYNVVVDVTLFGISDVGY